MSILGTFAIDGRPTVGVVLRDSIVVDLAAAIRAYEAEARRKDRGAPYLFLKAMEGAVGGDVDDILMPRGRERVDCPRAES